MEYGPTSKLQVNINDFSSLLRILKSARQSGSVRIELQAVDEARVREPWRAHLLLVDGDVSACYLYRKVDGQRVLADKSVMLWLHSLGQRELLWSLESSAPRQHRLASPDTAAEDLSAYPSTSPNGQTGPHVIGNPSPDSHSAPPVQARSRTTANSLSVPRLQPSPQSSSPSGTEPLLESGLLMDLQVQMGPHSTTNSSSSLSLTPSSQDSLRPVIDPPSDPGFSINYQAGPHATTHPLAEQHSTGSQQTPPQRPIMLQPGPSTPVNWSVPSILTQVPYRIAPVDQGMDAWSRRHRQVFVLIDGIRSVAQIADMLSLTPATVEQIVTDLLSWGVVLCI